MTINGLWKLALTVLSQVSDSADCCGRKDMGIVVPVLDSPRTSCFACLEIVLWIVLINQGLVYCLCAVASQSDFMLASAEKDFILVSKQN